MSVRSQARAPPRQSLCARRAGMSSLFSSLMGGAPKPSMGARLLERLSTAARLEDKRTALAEFKDVCLSIGGYRCLYCLSVWLPFSCIYTLGTLENAETLVLVSVGCVCLSVCHARKSYVCVLCVYLSDIVHRVTSRAAWPV